MTKERIRLFFLGTTDFIGREVVTQAQWLTLMALARLAERAA
jgi:hypothetical protein